MEGATATAMATTAMVGATAMAMKGMSDCTLLGHDADSHCPNTATTTLKIADEPDLIYLNKKMNRTLK